MKTRTMFMIVGGVAILLLAAGAAGALSNRQMNRGNESTAVVAEVASGINYQGRLTSPGGAPLNGTYTMRFLVYDADVGGSALWDSGDLNVSVENGLFNVKLGVDQADFDGQALWLSIIVDGETLSPRQEILPAPYALSLRPGADIVAPATGMALHAEAAGGIGFHGDSENNYGIWGSSNNSWGGYFTSSGGYGIRVNTDGSAHYDHGAYITSAGGYGLYAQSSNNQAVRGEAGDITGFAQPLGPVGVVGIGTSRGVFGSSGDGSGIYGSSNNNYGMWGQSTAYRGVTGRTNRGDNNYGLYTPDNLYSLNVNLAGAIMQVMQNNGREPLAVGDVVVFSGVNTNVTAVDGPVVQVSKANTVNSTAVAGVVFSRFNIDAVDPALEPSPDAVLEDWEAPDVTLAGEAVTGEYVLVVVQGPALVNIDTVNSHIQPGDLLSTAAQNGLAGKAEMVTLNGVETAVPGTVFGKALEATDGSQTMIYVYVTLQ